MPKWHSSRFIFLTAFLVMALFVIGCSDDEDGPTSTDPGHDVAELGDIYVRTQPATIDIGWILTKPDGSRVNGVGNLLLDSQPEGEYSIAWPAITGWQSRPISAEVDTLDGTNNLVFSVIYNPQPGTVMINIEPEGIAADWTLDGPSGYELDGSGDATIVDLVPGNYELIMSEVEDLGTPSNVVGSLSNLTALILTAEYAVADTVLFVNPQPEETEAPWSITGPQITNFAEETGPGFTASGTGRALVALPQVLRTQNNGNQIDTVTVSLPGDYTITWGDVENYHTPEAQTLNLLLNDNDPDLTFTGSYVGQVGSVNIVATVGGTSLPWALYDAYGAPVTGVGDATLEGMRAGEYRLTATPLDGWNAGEEVTGLLGAGGTLDLVVAVDPALTLRVLPEGLAAPWTLTGPNDFSLEGVGDLHLTDVATGCYDVTWGEIQGWVAPAGGNYCLSETAGIAVTADYSRDEQTLFVNVQPAGTPAPWSIAGPDGFTASGTGQAAVELGSAGDYTITWEVLAGHLQPVADTLTYSGSGSEEIRIVYLPEHGFVEMEGGDFLMGSIHNEACRSGFELQHTVILNTPFLVRDKEVTNLEYALMVQWAYDRDYVTVDEYGVMDNLDGSAKPLLNLDDPECEIQFVDGVFSTDKPNYPVREVTWFGAASYCDWLSMYRGLERAYNHETWECGLSHPTDAEGFRLPMEAEWEYTARSGSNSAYCNFIAIRYSNSSGECYASGGRILGNAQVEETPNPEFGDGLALRFRDMDAAISFATPDSTYRRTLTFEFLDLGGGENIRSSVRPNIPGTWHLGEIMDLPANMGQHVASNVSTWEVDGGIRGEVELSGGILDMLEIGGQNLFVDNFRIRDEIVTHVEVVEVEVNPDSSYTRYDTTFAFYDWGDVVTFENLTAGQAWGEVYGNAVNDTMFTENGASGRVADFYLVGDLRNVCWYERSSGGATHEVGTLYPNQWDIFDMHGNVQEWCNDWMMPEYYSSDPQYSPLNDPAGPTSGSERVVRGGHFFSPPGNCRNASRESSEPASSSLDTGFRYLMSVHR